MCSADSGVIISFLKNRFSINSKVYYSKICLYSKIFFVLLRHFGWTNGDANGGYFGKRLTLADCWHQDQLLFCDLQNIFLDLTTIPEYFQILLDTLLLSDLWKGSSGYNNWIKIFNVIFFRFYTPFNDYLPKICGLIFFSGRGGGGLKLFWNSPDRLPWIWLLAISSAHETVRFVAQFRVNWLECFSEVGILPTAFQTIVYAKPRMPALILPQINSACNKNGLVYH